MTLIQRLIVVFKSLPKEDQVYCLEVARELLKKQEERECEVVL